VDVDVPGASDRNIEMCQWIRASLLLLSDSPSVAAAHRSTGIAWLTTTSSMETSVNRRRWNVLRRLIVVDAAATSSRCRLPPFARPLGVPAVRAATKQSAEVAVPLLLLRGSRRRPRRLSLRCRWSSVHLAARALVVSADVGMTTNLSSVFVNRPAASSSILPEW